jgi:hypothetical protein
MLNHRRVEILYENKTNVLVIVNGQHRFFEMRGGVSETGLTSPSGHGSSFVVKLVGIQTGLGGQTNWPDGESKGDVRYSLGLISPKKH